MNNGKVRIYELSKELNLDNHYVLNLCDQLNITYKSHSSTISESEAERIRAWAEKHPPSETSTGKPTHHRSKSQGSEKPIKKKKQQILEVRRHSSEADKGTPSATDAPRDPSDDSLSLQSPPLRPSPSPALKSSPPTPPVDPDPQPQEPAVSPGLAEKTAAQESAQPSSESPSRDTTPTPSMSDADQKTELIGPPVRPTPPTKTAKTDDNTARETSEETVSPSPAPAAKPAKPNKSPKPPRLKRSGNGSKSESSDPKKPQGNKPIILKDKDSGKAEKSGGGKKEQRSSGSGDGAAVGTKSKKSSKPDTQKEKLSDPLRPRPVRPGESTKGKTDNSDDEDLLIDPLENSEPEEELELELRRPMPRPTKKVKKRSEEEDDDDRQKSNAKSGKGVTKKRRPHIIEDDLDDDLDDENEDGDSSTEVSLSLVRPAKPKGPSTSSPKPTGTPVTKKRSPSQQRDNNRNRRMGNKGPEKAEKPEIITLKGELMVRELATLLVVPETEVVKRLFNKGIAATVTQTLDLETAIWVSEDLGVEVETPAAESEAKKTQMLEEGDLEHLHRRPPVVTIMGHVDHGKTTLLDAIRKTKIVDSEAGGITQHIGAYHVDVDHDDKTQQIVFLDTPGHEAFTAMRARGTKVTDIAILVVAADDGVRPQTIEAISHAKAAEVPIVVAINKIDKEGASPDRVKQELMEHGLVPEEWGGDTIMVPVSAIQGENLDGLLEMLLLVSEVEELSANPDRLARGTIIEAHLDKSRGPVATLLVQNGTLRVGDAVVAGATMGKVRAMVDDRGERVEEALPSFAVEVLGLSELPSAGDEFECMADEKEARAIASSRADAQRETRLQQALASRRVTLSSLSAQVQEGELKELNLVLKADVQGSVEAILGSLQQLPQNEVQLRILLAAAGEVTETDVDLAAASNAVIIAFNTTFASGARAAADQTGVDVREYDIIYNLLDDIEGAMEGLLDPELVEEELGQVEVRAVFAIGKGSVAGCYVLSGKAIRNCNLRVTRGQNVIYEGFLDSLRRERDDVKEVNAGFECGIGVDKFTTWQVGDLIHTYRMVTKRRTLSS
ncbi:translation initiation factor IF-2 [Roseofilum capinflatum]|uniref:Translation initiation factor IF-2 n=1 Tax=Roseofilum capinflatum BLCC-M114 TaxID=3022440 RepID=A0ABT7B8S6_9CYAN|nr:translation initiation factor IF-2 [Roseofilum capinflatum]MDJ1175578.1 translation initiation factor IF-2 [Roseofilum capinflatum BLCC-M114]